MNKAQLAKELGISRQMVYKLIDKGMPTDSVESAKQWRDRYLYGHMTKNGRINGNTGVKHGKSEDTTCQDMDDKLMTASIKHALAEEYLRYGLSKWDGWLLCSKVKALILPLSK